LVSASICAQAIIFERSADRRQSLVNYGDFRDTRRNVRTDENRHLAADGWLFGGRHLLGGLRQHETKYSAPFPQQASYQADGAEGGVRYLARSCSSVTYLTPVGGC
jgi:hypothetical protein